MSTTDPTRSTMKPVAMGTGRDGREGREASQGREGRPLDAKAADMKTWSELMKYLRRAYPDQCRQWFDELTPLGFHSGVMLVRASSDTHRDYLQRTCINAFVDAARAVTELLVSVRFLGPNDEAAPPPPVRTLAKPLNAPAAVNHVVINTTGALPTAQHLAMQSAQAQANHNIQQNVQAAAQHAAAGYTQPQQQPQPRHQSPDTNHPNSAGRAAMLPDQLIEVESATPSASAVLEELLGATASVPRSSPSGSGTSWGMSSGGQGAGMSFGGGSSMRPLMSEVYTDGLTINPDNSFENFVQGPENRFALAAAKAVASGAGGQYNPLFLQAAVGLGKTHLLQAIVLGVKARRPDALVYCTSCEGFMSQFMDAVQAGVMAQFRTKFRHVDVLLIDDIHYLAKRERTQEEFFHTFNALHQAGKQIVLSSDAAPSEIPELEARLVSRFNCGLVAKLEPPTFETREQIVRAKAALRGVTIKEDVAAYVASVIDGNIRDLEGALTKLQVMADVDRREIDVALARQALGSADQIRPEPRVQMRGIIDLVTDYFGVTEADLVSKRRHRSVTQPRQLCMFLARHNTHFSLQEIGQQFGDRDHTTVMHAVRTIEDRCGLDAEFKQTVRLLEERLKGK